VVELSGNLTIELRLERAPVSLPPIIPALVDVKGRVRDVVNDIPLVDGDVFTDRDRIDWTGSHGEFRLKGVLEGVPLNVSVRAFGYVPLDTVIVPAEDHEYFLPIQPDSVVEALIAEQVQRIEDRPGFQYRTMDRDRIIRYAGRHTVESMMQFEAGFYLPWVRAVVVDGKRWNMTDEPVRELAFLLPEQVQRVEIGGSRRSRVIVIYTRDYIRRMILRENGTITCAYGNC
jgi:hypothetical protein